MHVMIDLETMGTRPNAPIIAIGAVAFDVDHDWAWRTFYATVNLNSAVVQGKAVISPDTVMWWLRQDKAAQGAFSATQDEAYSLEGALQALNKWLGEVCGGTDVVDMMLDGVWGNGATFDNVILRESYLNAGIPCPWPFWKDRCYRTVRAAYPDVMTTRDGTHHNALDDARYQARHLVAINEAAGGVFL